jgi:hypothetical protein
MLVILGLEDRRSGDGDKDGVEVGGAGKGVELALERVSMGIAEVEFKFGKEARFEAVDKLRLDDLSPVNDGNC